MVDRIQPTNIMRYPDLKAVVDDLIALGFGSTLIARRFRTLRVLWCNHIPQTIRTYRRSVAAPNVQTAEQEQGELPPGGRRATCSSAKCWGFRRDSG